MENEGIVDERRISIRESLRVQFPGKKNRPEVGSTKTSSARQTDLDNLEAPLSSKHSLSGAPGRDTKKKVDYRPAKRSSKKRLS